jgi:hypothetical protein
MKEKLLIELATFLVFILISVIVWRYVSKNMMYTQTEAEEEAHLKRLFGEAWREAKDL